MKKTGILAALLALLIVCTSLTVAVLADGEDNDLIDDWDNDFTVGDLDDDGDVDADDVALLRSYIAEKITYKDIIYAAADVNDDNIVNTQDLVLLKKLAK